MIESLKKIEISASALKVMAMVVMLIDHVAAAILVRMILLRVHGVGNDTILLYRVLRQIGRSAFPIYCYMLVEGLEHTRNKWKYLGRMILFAGISEIPFDLALKSQVLEFGYQNVYFTLAISLFMLIVVQSIERREWNLSNPILNNLCADLTGVIVLFGCMVVAYFLKTDYSYRGVLAVFGMYAFRKNKVLSLVVGYLVFWLVMGEFWAFPAFLLLLFYRGKKGFSCKYLFYGFYPVHLFLIYLVCYFMDIAKISAL